MTFEDVIILSLGLTSIALAILSTVLSILFFKYSKDNEKETSNSLTKISTQADLLQKVSNNLIDKLTDYATKGQHELIKDILNHSQPKPQIEQLNNLDTEKRLYALYVYYYYFIYKANFYISSSSFALDKNSVHMIKDDLNETYSEFLKTDKILSEYGNKKLVELPNYDTYTMIKNSKDNVKDGNFYLNVIKNLELR